MTPRADAKMPPPPPNLDELSRHDTVTLTRAKLKALLNAAAEKAVAEYASERRFHSICREDSKPATPVAGQTRRF